MSENKNIKHIPQEKFAFVQKDARIHDKKLDTKARSYFADALLRFRKNKSSVVAAWILLFLVLYIGCGLLGFRRAIDVLPIVGAVFNMLATFQRDEQKTRVLIFFNAGTYFSYYLALGATSMFAELLAAITALIGLVKYRKKK